MTRDLRIARNGAILTFVLGGLMCGSMTVRLPALSDELGLSEASIGVTLLVWGLGALVTMQSMRGVMTRFGSRSILRVGAPLCAVTLAVVAFAPTFPLLLVAVGLFGLAFGALDIAMNAQGSTVERAHGRPLMNGMHAGWCAGAISAGLLGTAAIAAGLSVTAHLTLIALLALPASVALSRTYLPDPAPETASESGTRRRMPAVVYLLGVIAFCAFMVEGTVADWNGLYLRDVLGAPEALAAAGYPVFEAGMLLGRLAGDRIRTRFGPRMMIAASGLATAATFAVVITSASPVLAVAAMLLVGLSVATVSPIAISLAGAATDNPGPAIAQTGALGYAGLLLGPVVIGFLSDLASLRAALGIAVALSLVIALTARFLPGPGTARTAGAADPEPELSMAA
ncbi:MFS transporter [Planobispora takensis]|uniref:MFS transporter n=1 Tax=Planobispora takensis TaxID=1367882 RepID=A0A8J3T2B0_9ACTN|nr:MFS transporter [Planobispora takensis]GII02730.1 MFS transporter [Planobispora takensis]